MESLWQTHRGWVAVVLLAHRPASELDDLLQDVALHFVRKISSLREATAFPGWLRRIAINVTHSAARRPTKEAAAFVDIVDPTSDGDDPGRWTEALRDTLHALDDLAVEYREPLLLKAVGNLSQRDIAEALELPETTVETRLSRGRRMLRDRLAQMNQTNRTPEVILTPRGMRRYGAGR